jgi:hypothetical protein
MRSFVLKHRAVLVAGTVVTVGAVAHALVVKQHNDFLKENGLYDAFYADDEETTPELTN